MDYDSTPNTSKRLRYRAQTMGLTNSCKTSSVYDNDEFKRIVGLSLAKGSSLMMRKDRNGIAITKGSKRHKIMFRDELADEVSKA